MPRPPPGSRFWRRTLHLRDRLRESPARPLLKQVLWILKACEPKFSGLNSNKHTYAPADFLISGELEPIPAVGEQTTSTALLVHLKNGRFLLLVLL